MVHRVMWPTSGYLSPASCVMTVALGSTAGNLARRNRLRRHIVVYHLRGGGTGNSFLDRDALNALAWRFEGIGRVGGSGGPWARSLVGLA